MAKLSFTIFWKKNAVDIGFRNPWVEPHVDNYQINDEARLLELLRTNDANTVINLNEVIVFEFEKEK